MDNPSPSRPPRTWLRRSDVSPRRLHDALEDGSLVRVRRNLYLPRDDDVAPWVMDDRVHRALLDHVREGRLTGVVCLESAALLHGGTPLTVPTAIHLAVGWNDDGMKLGPTARRPDRPPSYALGRAERRRRLAHRRVVRHRYPLPAADVVEIGGLRVTDPVRTMEDCARFLPPDRALAVLDSLMAVAVGAGSRPWDRHESIDALAASLRTTLVRRLSARRRERGIRRARALVSAATPWSQSPWESEARRQCLVAGISGMRPQLPVDAGGTCFFADLGWPTARHVLEVDEAMKYVTDPGCALERQEWREAAILEAGFGISCITPEELTEPGLLAARLREVLPQTSCEAEPVAALRTRADLRVLRT